MSRKILSELFKGAWNNTTTYGIGDIVDNNGASYACIVAHINQEPPNATYWALLAEKGDTGAQGTQGTKGIVWKGQWSAGTYNEDDAVLYEGSAYISTALTTGEPTVSADWELLAKRGLYWKGDWSAGTYNENDAVYHNGSSYVATTETTEEPSGTATDWDVLALSGEVLGDTSSTNENIAVFDGITGKKIKDGGSKVSDLEAIANKKLDLVDNSDDYYVSQKGIKTYVDGKTYTIIRDYETSGSPHTWTKPAGLKMVYVELLGGGGSGGRFVGLFHYASGGGGGAFNKGFLLADDLSAEETITVGAGGGAVSSNGAGVAGGNSSFGTHIYAYGGGAGFGQEADNPVSGGGGGGLTSAGGNGTNDDTHNAGNPGNPFVGSGATTLKNGFYGGGGGGARNAEGGGLSYFGGGGGGAGITTAGEGGKSMKAGGGGAGSITSGVNATSGTFPGGGGGGYSHNSGAGNSGAGANGKVRVIEYY